MAGTTPNRLSASAITYRISEISTHDVVTVVPYLLNGRMPKPKTTTTSDSRLNTKVDRASTST